MQINVSNNAGKSFMNTQAKTENVNGKEPKGYKTEGGSKQDIANVQSGIDSFVKAPETSSVTYTREVMSPEVVPADEGVNATETVVTSPTEEIDFDKIQSDRADSLKNMIFKMLGEQIDLFSASTYVDLEVSEEVSQAAAEAIGENGHWSAEAVSERILNMAEQLSGGDPELLELMKEATIKGFEQAAGIWGDEMPSITSETYDLVMQGFEALGVGVSEE